MRLYHTTSLAEAKIPRCLRPLVIVLLAFLLTACAGWPGKKEGASHALTNDQSAAVQTGAKLDPPISKSAGAATAEEIRVPKAKEVSTLETKLYPGTGKFIAAPRKRKETLEEADLTFNFENTNIREVIKIILSDTLGLNYVLNPKVQGGVTFQTSRPLSEEALIPTLETLLRMHGAALVYSEGLYRVLPMGEAAKGGLTPQLGESSQPLPKGYSIRVVPLEYISATEMSKILQPMMPQGALLRTDAVRNLLILAGSGPDMGNLIDTVRVFDVDWMKGLSVGFFPLQYTKASDIVQGLNKLISAKGDSPLTGILRIVPIESVNSLLVVTPQPAYLDKAKVWIERLDLAGGETGGEASRRLFVYRVENSDAEELASLLGQLFDNEDSSNRSPSAAVAPGEDPIALMSDPVDAGRSARDKKKKAKKAPKSPAPFVTKSKNSDDLGANITQSDVKIVADKANNSLLITATPRDYRMILQALKKIDIVPLQVLVEAKIYEVSLEDGLDYGLQWFFETNHGDKDGEWFFNSVGSDSTLGTATGFNFSMISGVDTVRAVFSALADESLLNVVSAPSIMVLDNHTARIQVGREVPVATQQQQSTDASNSAIINSIQYRDTGVLLEVTPRVNPGGLVVMEIEQEVSDVLKATESGIASPTIITKNISSTVAVKHGEAIVLGGLISESNNNVSKGLPGLHNLPFVGWAFGSKNIDTTRTEMVVILIPKVISSDKDINAITRDFKARMTSLEGVF